MSFNFGTFDIEANNWIDFLVGGVFDGQTYRRFHSIRELLNIIDQKKYSGWRWYAHNGGRYDFLFLLKDLLNRTVKVRMIPVHGRLLLISCSTLKSDFVLADSYSLLPNSLDELTHGFGVAHAKQEPMDWTVKHKANERRLLRYLEADCVGLHEVLTKFFDSDYVVNPKYTIASQALDTFRSLFLGDHHLETIDNEDTFKKDFYSGGRVEVYKGRGKNLSYFDVNSLFPFAMLHEMPCGEMRKTQRYDSTKIGFYSVTIGVTPNWYISPLLTKGKKNFYVNGKGEYFLSSETLNYLKSEFGIRFRVNYGFVFSDRRDLFTEYVTKFYDMKQRNRGNALYYIAKYFLNALYGKLGQGRNKESIQEWDGFKQCTPLPGAEDYGLVLVEERSKSKFILPYLAAYITELARLQHFKLMNLSPHSMFYCDTDSLLTNNSEPYKALVGREIGKLSVVGKTEGLPHPRYDGIFLNPKFYALRETHTGTEKIVVKGFDDEAFCFDDFERALMDRKTVLQSKRDRVMTYAECLEVARMKNRPSKVKVKHTSGMFLNVTEEIKRVKAGYDKRHVVKSREFFFDTLPKLYREIVRKK